MPESRLFKPLKLGSIELTNRVAMAPLTRFRADDEHVPLPFVKDYYGQRASFPGTLLISEATFISKQHGGYPNIPGIYNQAQIDAWKKITDQVHKKGSFIYIQLWALGRVANKQFAEANGFTVKSSSATQLGENDAVPQEMTLEDIKETVATYAQAAKNAIAAGFDGVEIHGANGYLIDQFLQDNCNKRTDSYGGSVENRSRFAVEVTQAVVDAVGADKTGLRLSPFSDFQGMKMEDPIPQFSDIIKKLDAFNLSYVHLVESRVSGNADIESTYKLNPFLPLYRGPLLIAGGFRADSAKRLMEEHKDRDVVVVFGRYFISNPDLVFRLQKGIEFNEYNRDTFYNAKSEEGYTDYPFSKEFEQAQASL
ncbi:12-oxophytodienoate reductase 1 [Cucurbitaria berberidis CBS 394.84]|uniref:12-oxophytodienoate reductase 1 n=1 Tax=Cucurbitaria berberidis CBS 394.84 TaxID=1168544 RepID=A0A9P4L5S1_9PLEO|nr:12-oxophytodienoate reductase 1 [Cucurbitaria berberidis CBS 394.84]KAF1842617.1 12-oxophytodienoate reductase 1 [Cucurbitaria berberidis CBS 394.84]